MSNEDRREKLRERLVAIEKRVAALEGAAGREHSGGDHATSNDEEIAALGKRIREIEGILYGCG